jgi:hypothetical protein
VIDVRGFGWAAGSGGAELAGQRARRARGRLGGGRLGGGQSSISKAHTVKPAANLQPKGKAT